MIGHQRDHDTCSGVELVLAALLSQAYAAFSRVCYENSSSRDTSELETPPQDHMLTCRLAESNLEDDKSDILWLEYALGTVLRSL